MPMKQFDTRLVNVKLKQSAQPDMNHMVDFNNTSACNTGPYLLYASDQTVTQDNHEPEATLSKPRS